MDRKERIGGAEITNAEARPVAEVIQDCHLCDLAARGAFFTWNNKHENGTLVYIRIDMVFINEEWLDSFHESFVHFLPEGLFDHCPCLVRFEEERQRKGSTFKYLNMWSLSPEYEEIVLTGWNRQV
ncbi:uncharacterized protein LOC141614056 [Silene latifolia]|uniref:uncharacterized protein LOC141614056 n=1 Tax=Silene latifolia TaxID=37657 RepID=UPI003D78802D